MGNFAENLDLGKRVLPPCISTHINTIVQTAEPVSLE